MKRRLGIGSLALFVFTAASCEHPSSTPTQRTDRAPSESSAHETLPAQSAELGSPIYDLEMTLTDQNGRVVPLDTHRGHPVVISMFYGSCPFACPTLIGDIKRLEKSLDEEARKDLRVLLVSFDPERDTPPRLAELGRKHGLDATRFELCRAPESQVRELAAVLGIQYRKLPSGGFNHSSVITVLDASGNMVGHVDGLERPVSQLVDAVRRARASRAR